MKLYITSETELDVGCEVCPKGFVRRQSNDYNLGQLVIATSNKVPYRFCMTYKAKAEKYFRTDEVSRSETTQNRPTCDLSDDPNCPYEDDISRMGLALNLNEVAADVGRGEGPVDIVLPDSLSD